MVAEMMPLNISSFFSACLQQQPVEDHVGSGVPGGIAYIALGDNDTVALVDLASWPSMSSPLAVKQRWFSPLRGQLILIIRKHN